MSARDEGVMKSEFIGERTSGLRSEFGKFGKLNEW